MESKVEARSWQVKIRDFMVFMTVLFLSSASDSVFRTKLGDPDIVEDGLGMLVPRADHLAL